MDVDVSRLRQLIRRAEESREDHVQAILQERGPLRRGSIAYSCQFGIPSRVIRHAATPQSDCVMQNTVGCRTAAIVFA
jgi:hypothetical protein